MRVPKRIPEHVFVWPLGDSVPEHEKIRVVCQVPTPSEFSRGRAQFAREVTDERTSKTYFEYDHDRIGWAYDLSVIRIEGVQDEDGVPVDPVRAKEKLTFYVRVNFGLDEDVHGVFQNEFGNWFNKKILRSGEEAKKNVTDSPKPATDSGVETTVKAGAQ